MKVIKCPCCGANVPPSIYKSFGKCEYCDSPLILESEELQNSQSSKELKITDIKPETKNNIPPRPVLNVGLAIMLLFVYIIFGIIYIACVKSKQIEWDQKYGK